MTVYKIVVKSIEFEIHALDTPQDPPPPPQPDPYNLLGQYAPRPVGRPRGVANPSTRNRASVPELLTVREAAKMLGMHQSTVRAWAESGKLEKVKLGTRTVRITRKSIRALTSRRGPED